MPIPIIDLFAGPGGLGEGFSAFATADGRTPFELRLSIEKDPFAHRTLELRSFFRQFPLGQVPDDYYQYCRGEILKEDLYARYPAEASTATSTVWRAELGKINTELLRDRIRRALAGEKNWVLIGGPPCQAYSTVGRSRMRGADPDAFEADDRHFLYTEYLKILRDHAPAVFVMENVKGLLSSQVGGRKIFQKIVKDLRRKAGSTQGYEVYSLVADGDSRTLEPTDYLVRFERFGIPQNRHRVLLVGIRRDLDASFRQLEESTYTPTVRDALGDLPPVRSGLSKERDSYPAWVSAIVDYLSFDWGEYSMDVDLMQRMKRAANGAKFKTSGNDRYLPREEGTQKPSSEWLRKHHEWFCDPRLGGGTLNHQARSHMRQDLIRYLFVSAFGDVKGVSPRLRDFPPELLPNHGNVHKALRSDYFADRFRVQIWDQPATTVLSHMAKDGHYFIHPAPEQCRSLTVREAARLQTFPDNYFFEGPRTEQYRQVGNAVPPLFAREVAKHVYDVVSQIRSRTQETRSLVSMHG